MVNETKYEKGEKITSIDKLLSLDYVLLDGKIYSVKHLDTYSLKTLVRFMDNDNLYTPVVKKKTILDDFIEKYPNATIGDDECPKFCPEDLGYKSKDEFNCQTYMGSLYDCKTCWNRPLEEMEGQQ